MDLSKWADDNSYYLRIEDGEKVQCTFVKAEEVADSFDVEKTKIRYTFKVNGVNKTFDSSSAKLALMLSNVKEGEIIEILRQGEGMKTRYQVKTIVSDKEPKSTDKITEKDLEEFDKEINSK